MSNNKDEKILSIGNDCKISFEVPRDKDEFDTDTEVKINGVQLCWISKPDLLKFYKEMQEIVLKYRIWKKLL